MTGQQTYSLQQVQTTCRRLIEAESHLIEGNVLPRRAALIAHVFAMMAFDDLEFLDSNLISNEQAQLIEHYSR
jgi:hypothetical protein